MSLLTFGGLGSCPTWSEWNPTLQFLAASQQDVFKSIENNVDSPIDARLFLALLLCAASAVLFLAYISRRRKMRLVAAAENHPGHLLKEISKKIDLEPADLKRLKAMQLRARNELGMEVQSPLTLMLCPSVLGKVMKSKKQ
jgi:hypothetical protein